MTKPSDNLFLEVRKDSQLAKILERVAQNPQIRTEEVCSMWQQKGWKGETSTLTPTRGSFLLDLLADATEGLASAQKPAKGVALIKGVRGALKMDANSLKPAVETKGGKTTIVVADDIHMNKPVVRPEPLPVKVDVEATLTPAGDEGSGEVKIIFPEAPSLPSLMASFIDPEWYRAMEYALDNGEHVSISGPPGIGKSTAAEQYFIRRGQPFITINCDAGLRRKDLVGTPELAGGSSRFVCAEYAAAAIFGWGVIINEINAADADALLFMNGQLETPFTVNVHGRSYPVHKDFKMVVTYNHGLVGTKPLPQAFKDRFFPVKLGFPTIDVLKKILVAKGMPSHAVYAEPLLRFAEACFNHFIQGAFRYQLSPRRLAHVVFLMEGKVVASLKDAITAAVTAAVDSKMDVEVLDKLRDEFAVEAA